MLKGSDEGVLRKLLGEADIAHQARDACYQPRLLDPEDRVDGAMYVGGHHGRRSQHYRRDGASESVGRRSVIRPGAQSTPSGLPHGRVALHLLARHGLSLGFLWGERFWRKIRGLENRPQLALSLAEHFQEALGPMDRLFHRLHLE